MADNLDIRAKLSADDLASPKIKQLVAQFDRLSAKAKQFVSKPIISNIVDPKVLKQLQGTGREIDGLTQKYIRLARNMANEGQMTETTWRSLNKRIRDAASNIDSLTKSEKKALAEQIKLAQAMKYVWNNQARERERIVERMHGVRLSAENEANRAIERQDRDHKRRLIENQRALMRNLRHLRSRMEYGLPRNRGTIAGLAAAGAIGFAGRSIIKQAVSVDKAETFARMNMDQKKVNARQLRDKWALPTAVDMGVDPGELLKSAVEAAKAGVPESMAAKAAELATKVAKGFEIGMDQMMDGLGHSIAQEIGSGRLKEGDTEALEKKFNIATALANQTASRPDQIMAFMKTGIAGGAALGMSQEASMAFGNALIVAGAQGMQSGTMLSRLGTQLHALETRAKTVRRKHRRSPSDRSFLSMPEQLGFGSFGEIANNLRDNPDAFLPDLLKRFRNIKDLQTRDLGVTAFFGNYFKRFILALIDSPGIMDESSKLAKQANQEKSGNNALSRMFIEYQLGLENMIDRISAVWSVLKTALGDSLKPFISQLSDWTKDWYHEVGTSGIQDRFSAILKGLTQGFLGRPGTFRDLLDKIFGKPGEMGAGKSDSYFKAAKGFAEGVKSVVKSIMGAIETIMGVFGKNSNDPEAVGKFTGQLLALVGALTMLSPLLSVMSLVVTSLLLFGGALKILSGLGVFKLLSKIPGAKSLGSKLALGAVGGGLGALLLGGESASQAAEYFTPDNAKKLPGESTTQYRKRRQEHQKQKQEVDKGLFHPSSYRSSVDDLSDQLSKFGGTVQRASFLSSAAGGFQHLSGGSSGGIVSGVPSSGGFVGSSSSGSGGGGNAMSLLHSTPGQDLPSFGVPGSGSILRRGSVSGSAGRGINGASFRKIFAGTPLADKMDKITQAAKANGIDPALLAGVIAHESGRGQFLSGNNPGGIMDPSTNWSKKMQFSGLDAGIDKTASVLAKNYNSVGGEMHALARKYAPLGAANDPGRQNGNWLGGVSKFRSDMTGSIGSGGSAGTGDAVAIAEKYNGLGEYTDTQRLAGFLGADPRGRSNAWCARFVNSTLAAAGGKGTGSAAAASFYKWGDKVKDDVKRNDVMVAPHHVGLATGNVSPDGRMIEMISGNHGDKVGHSWEPIGKYQLRRGPTAAVPLPQDAIKNVPAVSSGSQQVNAGGSSSGPVAININGSSHDPEALATLVQRRIDESMNRRTHDTVSAYT